MIVSLCGINLCEIDVLTHARVSIPNLYHYKLTTDDVVQCNKLPATERLLSFNYIGSSYPHKGKALKLKFYLSNWVPLKVMVINIFIEM